MPPSPKKKKQQKHIPACVREAGAVLIPNDVIGNRALRARCQRHERKQSLTIRRCSHTLLFAAATNMLLCLVLWISRSSFKQLPQCYCDDIEMERKKYFRFEEPNLFGREGGEKKKRGEALPDNEDGRSSSSSSKDRTSCSSKTFKQTTRAEFALK